MKKYIIPLFTLGASMVYSQVGINTENPQATLEVKSSATDLSKTDGIIAPKLSGNELKAKDELYTEQLQGAIVYATSATNPTTTKTANVTQEGYYYFDGNIWVRFSSGSSDGNENDINIYKDNGSLTDNRTANLNGFNLAFTGDGNIGIGKSNPTEKLDVDGDSRISGKVIIGAGAKNAALGVRNANSSEPIMRLTSASGSRRLTITDDGYVGLVINDMTVPTQRLDVDGNVRFRNVPNETTIEGTDRVMLLNAEGTGKKISMSTLKSEIDTDTNIYTNNGILSGNRTVNTDGKNLSFTGTGNVGIGTTANANNKLQVSGDTWISGKVTVGGGTKNAGLGVINTDASEPILRLTNTNNFRHFVVTNDGDVGIGLGTGSASEKLDVNGNVRFRSVPLETEIANTDRVMILKSDGTGKKVSLSTMKSEIDTNTNIYTNNGTLSGNRTVTLGGNNLNFGGTGAVGIGVASPTEKLDISGTARLRNVPNGNADNNQILVIDNSGVIRKSALPASPSFTMFITTKNSVTRNANENIYDLNFPGTPEKIYGEYIEREDNGTFRVKKAGIYTVELWAKFEDISAANSDARLGCRAILNIGGESTGMIGYRGADGGGNTGITRTKILSVGNRISASTSCNRDGGTYKTSAGSSLFITYMPL